MKYKANLMAGLIGLTLLAAPITATAKDNDRGNNGRSNSSQSQPRENRSQARSNNPPQRSFDHAERNVTRAPETRNPAPEKLMRSEPRPQRDFHVDRPSPPAAPNREARDERGDRDRWNHDRSYDHRHDGDREHRYNGDRDDYDDDYAEGAPNYVMPYGYAGGACGWARHLRNVYNWDLNTGHPSAAADLLPQLRRAERRCGGVPYGYYDGYSYVR